MLREYKESGLTVKSLCAEQGITKHTYYLATCGHCSRVSQVAVGHRKVYYYRLNNPNSTTTLPDTAGM